MKKYGKSPDYVKHIPIKCKEMMFYMYLPIKMAGEIEFEIPERLRVFMSLIEQVIYHEQQLLQNDLKNHYIYITAKHLYVTPDNVGNRPGWHSDGFMTEDINYIWCDKHPTIFNRSEFNLSTECNKSLRQMVEQADPRNDFEFPEYSLLRLDQYVIHRTPDITEGCMRTFVKISISKHKYNLAGNSHNYELDYDWKMYSREEVRNHPTHKEKDFINEEV